jgi:hypothetical protein
MTRLLLSHVYGEVSILVGELPEESEHFRFLRVARLTNLKGSVDIILSTASVI